MTDYMQKARDMVRSAQSYGPLDIASTLEALDTEHAAHEATKAELQALREALEWYAKDYDHDRKCSQWDGGAKARQALTRKDA